MRTVLRLGEVAFSEALPRVAERVQIGELGAMLKSSAISATDLRRIT